MIRPDPQARIAFSLGLAAALLALCLRLMMPAGWMPVSSGNSVVFTLCSGSGEQRLVIGSGGVPADTGTAHEGGCAFSGLGVPDLPDAPVAAAPLVFAVFLALGLAATPLRCLPARAWLRPPLRGPPPIA